MKFGTSAMTRALPAGQPKRTFTGPDRGRVLQPVQTVPGTNYMPGRGDLDPRRLYTDTNYLNPVVGPTSFGNEGVLPRLDPELDHAIRSMEARGMRLTRETCELLRAEGADGRTLIQRFGPRWPDPPMPEKLAARIAQFIDGRCSVLRTRGMTGSSRLVSNSGPRAGNPYEVIRLAGEVTGTPPTVGPGLTADEQATLRRELDAILASFRGGRFSGLTADQQNNVVSKVAATAGVSTDTARQLLTTQDDPNRVSTTIEAIRLATSLGVGGIRAGVDALASNNARDIAVYQADTQRVIAELNARLATAQTAAQQETTRMQLAQAQQLQMLLAQLRPQEQQFQLARTALVAGALIAGAIGIAYIVRQGSSRKNPVVQKGKRRFYAKPADVAEYLEDGFSVVGKTSSRRRRRRSKAE